MGFFFTEYFYSNLKEIKEKIENIVTASGNYFVDLRIRGNRSNYVIEVFIDNDKGVSVYECSIVSKEISRFLNSDNTLNNYRLMVSSPGIEYPLKKEWQFKKNIGRKIEVLVKIDNNKIKEKGILEYSDDNIIILSDENKKIEIKKQDIIIASVII